VAALRSLRTAESEVYDKAREFPDLLDEWLLRIPSSGPPNAAYFAGVVRAVGWVFMPEHWLEMQRSLWEDIKRSPVYWVLALLVFLILLLGRGRLERASEKVSRNVGSVWKDHAGITVAALFFTAAAAASFPAVIAFVGWRLSASGTVNTPYAFVPAFGAGLLVTAGVIFVIRSVQRVCEPRGSGERHFQWSADALLVLRRHLRWFLPVVVVPAFIVAMTYNLRSEEVKNNLGRMAFILLMGAQAFFIQRVFHPKHALIAAAVGRRPSGWIHRLRYFWYPILIGTPLILAVAAGIGYYYTALILMERMLVSALFLLVVLIVFFLCLRWLTITQRRLAVEEAIKKRKEEAEARQDEESGKDQPELDIPELDLSATTDQSRRLLVTFTSVAVLVGLWFIWSDVLPALSFLDKARLWSTSVTDATGAVAVKWITLGSVLVAAAVVVLTIAAARNLPGMLEILILGNLPFDAGMRYALSTVSRYIVTGIGLAVALNMLGFGWSKVQWLAAALSVGIGFGLQEIIANFVCGLILLFERPIRIGDIVTIGDVTGTVSRIRIRATTVTNWDRQEYVVPNKELITGRLLNWTLSNTLNRVVINVGVAYGSDPEESRALLLKVAREHPSVLDDPEPIATFEGFGDSALSMVLRCYLADFAERLHVIHQLHAAVAKAFTEAGIEIAFPQLDVHLKSDEPTKTEIEVKTEEERK